MRKRRNSKKTSSTGGEVNSSSSNRHGDGASKNDKLSVFEFDYDDLRVEDESRKALAKFGPKSPTRKPQRRRQPVDKYVFLECFAQGTAVQQNDSRNNLSDVDVADSVFENRTSETDVIVSPGSLNYESHAFSFSKHQGFGCSSCEAKSWAQGSRKPGGYMTAKKNIKVFYVDSDEDEIMELRPSTSSFNQAENKDPLEERSSNYGAKSNDCEAIVVVAPNYAKYGNKYYTRCLLTFSQRCIRLEGSPLCETRRAYCIEWSTFDILKIEYQQYESVKADFVNLHLNCKGMNIAETGNGNSGTVELEFVVLDDPRWFKKQEEIKSLDLKYRAAWKTITSECSFNKSFEDIIYPDGDPDAVFISERDIELLQPRTFINDTIIDFYIKYLLNKTKPEGQRRFHFFNTFFFRKLAGMDRDSSRERKGQDAFQRVRKWTRNVDLFEKDYVFIPVNFSLHWSLIIICHPGEVANLRENLMDEPSKVPCILHMDSIRGSHRGFENLIRSYLWEEWKEQQNKQEEEFSTKFLNLEFVALQLPQQENLFDCGLFLLHYAELFLEQVSNFTTTKYFDFENAAEDNRTSLSLQLNKDWFHPAEVSLKKRDHIRKLIYRIAEDNALKDSSGTCNNKYLQSGTNEGDGGAQSVQENCAEESCLGTKFNSSNDYEIKGQQYLFEQRNIDKSVADEICQLRKPLVPINHISNMRLPVEEGLKKQTTFPPEETESCRYEADEDDKSIPTHYPLISFMREEMQVSSGISKTCSGESPLIIDEQNEVDCAPEVAFTTERDKERNANSSMSSEDLAACVVEDSEEEYRTESIRKTRRSSFLI